MVDMPPEDHGIKSKWLLQLLKLRVWIFDHIHPSELQVTLAWAGIIGFTGGVSSVTFRKLTHWVHWFSLSNARAGRKLHALQLVAAAAHPGGRAGCWPASRSYLGMRWKSRRSSTDYMEAIALGDGVVSARGQPGEKRLGAFLHRLRRLHRPRRPVGAALRDDRLAHRPGAQDARPCNCACSWPAARRRASPPPTMPPSPARSSSRRSSSQSLCHGDLRAAGLRLGGLDADRAAFPRRKSALRNPVPVRLGLELGDPAPTCCSGSSREWPRPGFCACCGAASGLCQAPAARHLRLALGGLIVGVLAIHYPRSAATATAW